MSSAPRWGMAPGWWRYTLLSRRRPSPRYSVISCQSCRYDQCCVQLIIMDSITGSAPLTKGMRETGSGGPWNLSRTLSGLKVSKWNNKAKIFDDLFFSDQPSNSAKQNCMFWSWEADGAGDDMCSFSIAIFPLCQRL